MVTWLLLACGGGAGPVAAGEAPVATTTVAAPAGAPPGQGAPSSAGPPVGAPAADGRTPLELASPGPTERPPLPPSVESTLPPAGGYVGWAWGQPAWLAPRGPGEGTLRTLGVDGRVTKHPITWTGPEGTLIGTVEGEALALGPEGAGFVGTLGEHGARFDAGDDVPVFIVRRETWWREWAEKAGGRAIPVQWPVFWLADPAKAEAVASCLSPAEVLGDPREQQEKDGWLDAVEVSVDEKVSRNGLASVRFHVEGSGAYPSSYRRDLTVDLRVGACLGAEQFDPGRAGALLETIRGTLERRAKVARRQVPEAAELLGDAVVVDEAMLGRWTLGWGGLTFHHDFGFPHAVQAAEPDGDVFVSWRMVEPALTPGAALRRAIP